MKFFIKNKLTGITVISLFCCLFFVKSANAQIFPITFADSVNVFSLPQPMLVKNQLLHVRVKLLRHFGTTCQFEIEITNRSEKDFSARVGFVSMNSNQIYDVNSAYVRLKSNYYAVYKLELRECLKRGKKNPLESCLFCNPRLGFL